MGGALQCIIHIKVSSLTDVRFVSVSTGLFLVLIKLSCVKNKDKRKRKLQGKQQKKRRTWKMKKMRSVMKIFNCRRLYSYKGCKKCSSNFVVEMRVDFIINYHQ